MATLLWPLGVLPPRELMIDIAPRSLAGPSSVSGVSQVVASDAGIWKATYAGIPVVDDQKVLAWRAINNLLEGRLISILVPIWRWYQPVPAEADELALYDPVPHSDQSPFSDGSMYQGGVIDVTLASSIPLRGVTANISIKSADMIQPGQHFSIEGRLYRVRTVNYTSETTAAITFRPPAREAASVGARLEFDFPVCRMRLASDGEMDLPLDYGRWSFPTVNFIEDV